MPVAEHAGIASLRRQLGLALRRQVADEEAARRAPQIWGRSGARWFCESDPIWRVQADASMFAGGLAALLLQSLHPSAMAGVAGHSGYRGDPWGRLQRTGEYLATTTFGTIEHAEEIIARVRCIHERVRGKDYFGRPYRASDPNLLRWVHVAENWAFLQAHQRYGQHPLTAEEADLFVEQCTVSAEILGATNLPRTARELQTQLEGFRSELRCTPQAVDSMKFMLLHPPVPPAGIGGYAPVAAGAVALLPAWARSMLGLPNHRPLVAAGIVAGKISTGSVRWALGALGDERLTPAPPVHPRVKR